MISVITASSPSQYNTTGEIFCMNGGALFANNVSLSNETRCNATAQWTISDFVNCFTGILTILQ